MCPGSLKGSYFETCSCDVVRPCAASLAFGATHERCRVTLVFTVKDGEVEGTDVSGLRVAAVADTPKVMTEGNWRLGVFIDAAASDEQTEKLGGVFSGGARLGGPMEALGPLVGESLGVERARIEVREDGLRHSIRIGDAVAFEIEDIVPFGVETGEPAKLTGIFHAHRLGAGGGARDPLKDRRVRDQVRGQRGFLHVAVLVGGVSAAASALVSDGRSDRNELARRSRPSAPGLASLCCCSRWRRWGGGRRRTGWPGWTAVRGPTSALSAGSWESGW